MDTMTPNNQHYSENDRPDKPFIQFSMRKSYVIGSLFLVGAVIAIPFVISQSQEQQTIRGRAQVPTIIPSSTNQSFDAVIDTADNFDARGQYPQVIQTFEQFIATNPAENEKRKARLKLASAYFNAKQYDKAITAYQQLAQNDEYKLASLHGLAYTYEAKGDNQKAIEYLQQAIAFMKASGASDTALMIAGDEQAIETLQNNP